MKPRFSSNALARLTGLAIATGAYLALTRFGGWREVLLVWATIAFVVGLVRGVSALLTAILTRRTPE